MLIGKQLERLVEQAMKDQAPDLYRELSQSNQLQTYLEEKAAEIEAVDEELRAPEMTKILESDLGPLERQQQATEMFRRTWEQALQTCLTFPEATITESPLED